jgi:hypothetical protein
LKVQPSKKKPPRITSGGNGKPFFWKVCRGQGSWLIVPDIPTDDAWSFGLWSCIGLAPADRGWEAHHDAWRRESLHRRFSRSGRLVQAQTPGTSLHPARSSRRCVRLFAESDCPSDNAGEIFGIPFANLTDFPSVLHPEGLRFLGVLQGWFAH